MVPKITHSLILVADRDSSRRSASHAVMIFNAVFLLFISNDILYCYLLRQSSLFSAAQPWRVLPTGFVCTVSLYPRPCVPSYPIQPYGVPKDINSGSHCLLLFCSRLYTIGKDGSDPGTPTISF